LAFFFLFFLLLPRPIRFNKLYFSGGNGIIRRSDYLSQGWTRQTAMNYTGSAAAVREKTKTRKELFPPLLAEKVPSEQKLIIHLYGACVAELPC
jgi:hypothetical protein